MKTSELLVALRDLVRPAFLFLVGSIAMIGAAQAGAANDSRVSFLVSVSILGWALFAATLNDLADRPVDAANLGHTGWRSVGDGRFPPIIVVTIAATAAALSLGVSAFLSLGSFLAALAGLLCAGLYCLPALRLSGRGVLTSLLLPLVYVVTPYATGRASTGKGLTVEDLLLVGGLYVSFIGRLLLKDFRDEQGDRLFGKRTFLVRHGRRATCLLSACAWTAGECTLLIARGSWTLAAAWLPLWVVALTQMRRIANDESGADDVYRVTMIAISGRATLASLLADIAMRQVGAPTWTWWLVQVTVVAFSLEAIRRWQEACRTNPARVAASAVPEPATP